VLVPNLKGAERAIECGAHAMLLPLSASHAHSLANLKRTPDEVVADLARIVDLRDAKGSDCRVEVGLSTAFGCTIQGRVEPAEVLRLVRAAIDVAWACRRGLDFNALMALRAQVGQWLEGEALHGAIWRAGLPKDLVTWRRRK
jgi:hydroxymethylglutaryl-CoA lyase